MAVALIIGPFFGGSMRPEDSVQGRAAMLRRVCLAGPACAAGSLAPAALLGLGSQLRGPCCVKFVSPCCRAAAPAREDEVSPPDVLLALGL